MVQYILLAWRSHFMAHTTTTTIASSPQRHDHPPQPLSSRAHRHCQVSLFFIFFTPRRWPARRRVASAALRRGPPALPPPALVVPLVAP